MPKDLPANFRRIRLERAREPGLAHGDPEMGYTLLAPLTADGRLDGETASAYRERCKVIRFSHDDEPEEGYLRRRGGGWVFHYTFEDGGEDDDPGFRFEQHRFVPGDYVTVIEDEGAHTYRVVTVQAV